MLLTIVKWALGGSSALAIIILAIKNKKKSRQIADLTEQLSAKSQELMWEKNKSNALLERSSQKYKLKNKSDEEVFNNWNADTTADK